MLPERCSIREKGRDCVNPPEFVVSIILGKEEYMIGVTCAKHKSRFSEKLPDLQKEGKVPNGTINFSGLKPVGTDCIRMDPDDLINF
ncbi:MAG: hypothetical protein ACE5JT_04850 [Nitrosopumilaceae archaeon]